MNYKKFGISATTFISATTSDNLAKICYFLKLYYLILYKIAKLYTSFLLQKEVFIKNTIYFTLNKEQINQMIE